jgi:type IV secretion system protein VirD4
LIRLILNQIGRRLTETLNVRAGDQTHRRLLLMLDEFPALGRLDFFESALAFMAGYGIRAYLIAQSLNQIAKAYGENNAILDSGPAVRLHAEQLLKSTGLPFASSF